MDIRYNTIPDDLMLRFREKHSYRYNYSQTVFIDMKQAIKIKCLEHGEFTQLPYEHTRSGCKECSIWNTEERTNAFIRKSKEKHGDTYIYDKVKYTGYKCDVKIKCKLHGSFKVIARNHQSGYGKCPTCSYLKKISKIKPNYDYSLVKYKNDNNMVKMICHKHGIYKTNPLTFHKSKAGTCPICYPTRNTVSKWIGEK